MLAGDDEFAALAVDIQASALRVSVLGSEVLAGQLCGKLRVEESSWCVDGEAAVLQLDLMKRSASGADGSTQLVAPVVHGVDQRECSGSYTHRSPK